MTTRITEPLKLKPSSQGTSTTQHLSVQLGSAKKKERKIAYKIFLIVFSSFSSINDFESLNFFINVIVYVKSQRLSASSLLLLLFIIKIT